MSLKSYITATRIEIAKSMLSSSNDINEIAFSVGYSDACISAEFFTEQRAFLRLSTESAAAILFLYLLKRLRGITSCLKSVRP